MNNIFLVWPEQLDGRKHLARFYYDYIRELSLGTNINIILKDRSIESSIADKLQEVNSSINYVFHEIPEVMDIWIKDWAPHPIVNDKGETVLIKAIYNPSYITKKYSRYANGDNDAGRKIAEILNLPLIDFPLFMDFGNFTENHNGTGIVTKRILKDNQNNSSADISDLFKEYFSISNLIIIDEEPNDVTGHVDGTIRFITPEILAISKYPYKYRKENRFLDKLEIGMTQELGDNIKIIRLMNGPMKDKSSEGIGSAWGNHMNFFISGNQLYLPYYSIDESIQAEYTLKEELKDMNIITIATSEINKLAHKGGVLNCMSWSL